MGDSDQDNVFPNSSGDWQGNNHVYPHSHHGTPAQEYNGFSFASAQLPMQPSVFINNGSSGVQHRPLHHQLQPLVMPQWPSMLPSQGNYNRTYQNQIQPVPPIAAAPITTPISANSARSGTTPRKTLTDLDRRRMCQYHEEHPNTKQTEIGGMSAL